jgi:hypothetical protein
VQRQLRDAVVQQRLPANTSSLRPRCASDETLTKRLRAMPRQSNGLGARGAQAGRVSECCSKRLQPPLSRWLGTGSFSRHRPCWSRRGRLLRPSRTGLKPGRLVVFGLSVEISPCPFVQLLPVSPDGPVIDRVFTVMAECTAQVYVFQQTSNVRWLTKRYFATSSMVMPRLLSSID